MWALIAEPPVQSFTYRQKNVKYYQLGLYIILTLYMEERKGWENYAPAKFCSFEGCNTIVQIHEVPFAVEFMLV
jgi:hypothetical protein